MTRQTTDKKIQEITQKIVQEYKPEKIILFGSWVWGKPHRDSDLDFFIVKRSKKRKIDRERELRTKLFGNDFPAMDLLIYTPKEVEERMEIEDCFIEDIFKKGKILYATK